MRAEIKSDSKEGQRIKQIVEKGAIVPSDLTVSLLLRAIKSTQDKVKPLNWSLLPFLEISH